MTGPFYVHIVTGVDCLEDGGSKLYRTLVPVNQSRRHYVPEDGNHLRHSS